MRMLDLVDLSDGDALQVLDWLVVWVDGQVRWECIFVFEEVGNR